MKKGIQIIKYLYFLFVIVIIPIMVFTLLTQRTDIIPQIKSFTVLTGSMQPHISVGSIIYTIRTQSYANGDIITFKRDAITVTHRITNSIRKNGILFYQTKGDANNAPDLQLVSPAAIIGKVFVTIPYIGIFSAYLKTFQGFMLLIALPIIVFIFLELITIKREMEKEIEKKILQKHNLYET